MSSIPHLYLLGPAVIRKDGAKAPLARKTLALLAYLVVTQRAHSRRALMNLFCQESDDPAAALRWHLSRIRRHVAPTLLIAAEENIRFDPDAASVDVLHFLAWITDEQRMAAAVDLYQGELLAGVDVKDAPEFELWLLGERSRIHHLYIRGLEQIMEREIAAGHDTAAIARAHQLLQSDPLIEAVHARLIWLYARRGQREDALRQYDLCVSLLERELAVPPTPALVTLRQQIAAGELAPRPTVDLPGPTTTGLSVEHTVALVGRDAELSALIAAQGVVLVAADAGGGKTSLVEACAAAQPARLFLSGRCYESTRSLPYRPWLDLLQQRLAQMDERSLDALPGAWLEQLARLLPGLAARRNLPQPADQAQQEQLFATIADFLLTPSRDLDEQGPLFFIDDLQWADAVSLQLFHFLAERTARLANRGRHAPLLIGAYRPEESEENSALLTLCHDLARSGAPTLVLPPLAATAVERLIARHWPDLPPGLRTPYMRDTLLAETGGNPLFVMELLRELSGAATLPGAMPIPPSLRALIHRRLHQMPASGRQVLEALAVLEVPATFDQVRATSGRSDDEGEAALEAGLRWRLLHTVDETARIDFQHALMRDAVLAEMTPLRRQRLHQRAAQTLAHSDTAAATLAYHWRMAGDVAQEGRYALLAGQQATALGAHKDAIGYLARAVACLPPRKEKFTAWIEWVRLLQVTSQWGEAATVGQAALTAARQAGNRWAQGRALVELARIARMQGENEPALRLNQEALDHLRAVNDGLGLSLAYSGMGAIAWAMSDYAKALSYFQEQLAIDEANQDEAGVSAAVGALGVVYGELGDYAQAHACYLRQLAICQQRNLLLDTLQVVANLAHLYAVQGYFDEAIQGYLYQIPHALAVGSDWMASVGVQRLAQTLLWQRAYDPMARASQQAVDFTRLLNLRYYLCEALCQQAALHLALGEWAAAAPVCAEAAVMAAEVQRPDIAFAAWLLDLRIRRAAELVTVAEALAILDTRLAATTDPVQRAELHCLAWEIAPHLATHREAAVATLTALYAQTPNIRYAQCLEALTGSAPPPPALPPLPTFIAAEAAPLAALLDQVDATLARLQAQE
jgi:DNA-binding SARP family transcriptional activator